MDKIKRHFSNKYFQRNLGNTVLGFFVAVGMSILIRSNFKISDYLLIVIAMLVFGGFFFWAAWLFGDRRVTYPRKFLLAAVFVSLVLGVTIGWRLPIDSPSVNQEHLLSLVVAPDATDIDGKPIGIRKAFLGSERIRQEDLNFIRGDWVETAGVLRAGPALSEFRYSFYGNRNSEVRIVFTSRIEPDMVNAGIDGIQFITLPPRGDDVLRISPPPNLLESVWELLFLSLVISGLSSIFFFAFLLYWYSRYTIMRYRSWLLILLILFVLIMFFIQGKNLGLDNGYSPYQDYMLAGGIARLYYQIQDYSYPCDLNISHVLIHNKLPTFTNPRMCFWGNVDLGGIDFVVMSLILFGPHYESPYYFWFLLFGISVALYCVSYFRQPKQLLILLLLELSIYAVIFVFRYSDQLGSLADVRVMGLMSSVAFLFLIHTSIKDKPFSWKDRILVILQSVFILFAILCRISVIYQIIGVAGMTVFIFLMRWRSKRIKIDANSPPVPKRTAWFLRKLLFFANSGFPFLVLILCLILLKGYQNTSIWNQQDQERRTSHTLWHNIGMGFCYHPVLKSTYSLQCNDYAMQNFVNRKAKAEDPRAMWFTGRTDAERYERLSKAGVLEIASSYPKEVVETFLIYKPRRFFFVMLESTGIFRPRAETDMFVDPLRIEIILLLIAGILFSADDQSNGRQKNEYSAWLLISFSLFVFASLPWIMTYPEIYIVPEALVFLLLFIDSIIVIQGLKWLEGLVDFNRRNEN